MYQLPNNIKSMLVKIVSPHLVLQHVKVFPDMYSYLISHTNVKELDTNHKKVLQTQINVKGSEKVKNQLKIILL